VDRPAVVEVHVTDDGPRFSVDHLPHAFERFTPAARDRGGDGAGLGLSIVDAIAGPTARIGRRAARTCGWCCRSARLN
jgi:signal transduction histidine kinase